MRDLNSAGRAAIRDGDLRAACTAGSAVHSGSAVPSLTPSTGGKLNFNDAFIVVLQREGRVGPVATFDAGFDAVPGFVRVPFVERTRG